MTGGTVAVRPEGRDTNVPDVATFGVLEPVGVVEIAAFDDHHIAVVRQAAEIVVSVGAARASLLMKRLGLYEAEAESLLDMLEAARIIGPLTGRARPVLAAAADIQALITAYEGGRT